VGAGESFDEVIERSADRIGERCGKPDNNGNTEGVTNSRRVLAGADAFFAGDGGHKRSSLGHQLGDETFGFTRLGDSGREFEHRLGAKFAEYVVDLVAITSGAAIDEALQLEFKIGHHVGIEKIAQFYEEEVDATLSGLTSLIEPILIVFLGVIIGGIVICMFMPIFKMHEIVAF
jgi:hypothetical protein